MKKSCFHTVLIILNSIFGAYSQNLIRANDSRIRYMGRIDYSDQYCPSYSYPGVTISAKFIGSEISAVIKDFGTGGNQSVNYYNVVVDGVTLHKVRVNSADTLYLLAEGLTDDLHSIKLIKRTESTVGKSSFGGFVIQEEVLEPPNELSDFKMEFIGDSWTCGYGNEVSTNSPNTGFNSMNEDNAKAWGYTLAERFDAQYHATAISGRGMYRNNTGSTSGVVPEEFENIHLGSTDWDPSNYVPDVVFIHLGPNDFFSETVTPINPLDSTDYVEAYIDFIDKLRIEYGSATKIV